MATPTVSDRPATQRQYATQVALSATLSQAVRTLWTSLRPVSSESAWRTFSATIRVLVPQYGQSAAQTALDNYRLARLDAGITTIPPLPKIPPIPASKIDAGLDWARRAFGDFDDFETTYRAQLDQAETTIRDRAAAAMQKALLDEAREATVAAVVGDDKALGYRRVPRPGACAWCLALAIRKSDRKGLAAQWVSSGGRAKSLRGRPLPGQGGEEHWGVYKSRATAGQTPIGSSEVNRFHRGCHCVVEPIFSTDLTVPDWLREVDDLYSESEDFNDFRRRLNARRDGTEPRNPDPDPVLPPPAAQPAQVVAVSNLLAGIDAAMAAA